MRFGSQEDTLAHVLARFSTIGPQGGVVVVVNHQCKPLVSLLMDCITLQSAGSDAFSQDSDIFI